MEEELQATGDNLHCRTLLSRLTAWHGALWQAATSHLVQNLGSGQPAPGGVHSGTTGTPELVHFATSPVMSQGVDLLKALVNVASQQPREPLTTEE